MSKPLFADSWYQTPRLPELRQEIQNLYDVIPDTLYTLSLKAHRISSYTVPAASAWYDWAFEEVVVDESLGGIRLEDDNIVFTFEREGLCSVSGCIRPAWGGVGNTSVIVATRIMKSDDSGDTWVEARCLQGVNARSFGTSEVGTQRFSGTIYAEPGVKMKLQVQVGDTDMSFAGWTGFDRPVSASIEIHGIGPATRTELLD